MEIEEEYLNTNLNTKEDTDLYFVMEMPDKQTQKEIEAGLPYNFWNFGPNYEKPLLEINGRFYQGTYEESLTSQLIFEIDENSSNVNYFSKTTRKIKFERVIVEKK
ncbi:transcription initiation factor iiic tfiiic polypeptide 6-related [Anaeramoeba ignava]|uniref:Transcription initiation factor iiic tfiiic polypeptide 6-related n=1 Tax=Anaeramoeba ignava TaxID=1746090 RepID=A0A9Q0LS39_ANAIG|nr:transcription initiation factor iiic tfiiic polypeptide 6-related [Anaeramoeba ignava]